MGVVAVRASDASRIHFRLQERSVDVNLVEDLPIRVVKPRAELRQIVCVMLRCAGQRIALPMRLAPRMAASALLYRALGTIKGHSQTNCVDLSIPSRNVLIFGPLKMRRSRSVAGFASHTHFGLC